VTESRLASIVSVYAIFASEEEARRIGKAMVEARHAACVNILGACLSFFRWQGEVEQAEEVAAIFKTSAEAAPALIAAIAEAHSYEVPAAVAWPISDAFGDYAAWVRESVGPQR
jgi:periplasmic divalent cation tolerance protein